jgi:hypothetical protein
MPATAFCGLRLAQIPVHFNTGVHGVQLLLWWYVEGEYFSPRRVNRRQRHVSPSAMESGVLESMNAGAKD